MRAPVSDSPSATVGRESPHRAGAPILSVQDLTVMYGQTPAVDGVSFELSAGDQVAVIGPNGAGKSTLFKAIAGVIAPTRGTVRVGGTDPAEHICIAYIPQRNQIDWSFPVTVADMVMMGRVGRLGWCRRPGRKDRDRVRDCLQLVHLDHLAGRQIGQLSGGEQQRMFLARALAQQAELMLMDEVMSACDVPSQEEIFRVLERLKEQRIAVMVSTHNLEDAASRFDRVLLMNQALIGLGSSTEVFVPDRLKLAYGGHLRFVNTPQGMLILNDACGDAGGCGHG
jgi:manganese/iron transport system ATP-binding protein